ncbi:ribonuclease R [Emcibacter sp.]|uniref:ribonuclease R n=1 Tax=Emcibacter sp. TaxID=1979954 RepID=UPI002AA7EF85|nr:ribonuclease R [Emcibacter sp.]
MNDNKHIPFPSKEEVLEFLEKNPDRQTKREIARAFHIRGDDRILLKAMLQEMKEDNLLKKGHKKQIHPDDGLPPVSVIEITGLDKMGDLKAKPVNWEEEGPPPTILIPAHESKGNVGVGDRILARLSRNRDDKSGYVARVIRKLETAGGLIMGFFRQQDDNVALVYPTDKKNRDIYVIGRKDWQGAKEGELVLIEAGKARRGGRGEPKPARVKECLGAMDEPRSISLIAVHAHGIPMDFSDEAVAEAEKSEVPVLEAGRADLRDIPLITIDPSDARDHDDAIWAEPDTDPENEGGWHVIVAIADVARYVRPGSALDKDARLRGNSVYFPDRVVPMLPERLSNGLCSLKENEDRYCMAVHMWFAKNGKKLRHKFVRGLMRSAAGLSYEEYQQAIDGKVSKKAAPLMDTVIKPLWGAYECLQKGRRFREPLELEVPERKITLGEDGHIESIVPRLVLPAHQLVEEFMIQANVSAAQQLQHKDWPCMYRIHDQPTLEKLEALGEFLQSLDYSFAKGQVMKPKVFNNILRKVKDTPHEGVVNTVVLRSQSQAIYSPDNIGHFGLSLGQYAHFTSPIRRYSDVMVHRALVSALKLGEDGLSKDDRENFAETAQHISDTERRAMLAERESTDRYVAAYMSDHVGDVFDGTISGVSRAGLFVTLAGSGGDGIVPVSSLVGDYFIYDKDLHLLEGEYTNIVYQLGDKVTVKLREANPVTGGLTLQMIDENLLQAAGRPGAPGKAKGRRGKGRPGAKPGGKPGARGAKPANKGRRQRS